MLGRCPEGAQQHVQCLHRRVFVAVQFYEEDPAQELATFTGCVPDLDGKRCLPQSRHAGNC